MSIDTIRKKLARCEETGWDSGVLDLNEAQELLRAVGMQSKYYDLRSEIVGVINDWDNDSSRESLEKLKEAIEYDEDDHDCDCECGDCRCSRCGNRHDDCTCCGMCGNDREGDGCNCCLDCNSTVRNCSRCRECDSHDGCDCES